MTDTRAYLVNMKETLTDRMTAIIKEATTVFAKKGYKAATIGEISNEVSLSEATIYNHFKNKEEILLCIPIFFWNQLFEVLDEHLQGIKNPEEKLRRFVWGYLWWAQKNPDFMRVYILEIQSIPDYYYSKAYELYRTLESIPINILEQGIELQIFRNDIDPELFKGFLLGTIEYLFMSKMLYNKPLNFLNDFHKIAGIFTSAIKTSRDKNYEAETIEITKKEKILISAENLFSKNTFDDVKISDIAKLSNLADGTLYKYFKNKEDILFTIFDHRMKEFTESFDEAVCPIRSETKLKYLLWHFLNWVQDNRQWAKIYLKDLITNPRFYLSNKYKAMKNHDNKLCRFFEEGKKSGAFRQDIEIKYFRAIVFGTMQHVCAPWAMLGLNDNLSLKLNSFYGLLLRAIQS